MECHLSRYGWEGWAAVIFRYRISESADFLKIGCVEIDVLCLSRNSGDILQAVDRAEWGARITSDSWGTHPTRPGAQLTGWHISKIPSSWQLCSIWPRNVDGEALNDGPLGSDVFQLGNPLHFLIPVVLL